MPIYLDVHKISEIKEMINSPTQDPDVKIINIFFNREADLYYYLVEAPSKQVIINMHSKFNAKCNMINEITMMDPNNKK